MSLALAVAGFGMISALINAVPTSMMPALIRDAPTAPIPKDDARDAPAQGANTLRAMDAMMPKMERDPPPWTTGCNSTTSPMKISRRRQYSRFSGCPFTTHTHGKRSVGVWLRIRSPTFGVSWIGGTPGSGLA